MKGKPANTKESKRMLKIKELGCIICGSAPCDCHHLLSGGVRRGHMFTIGLCKAHHTGEGMPQDFVSYHGRKKLFHAEHGYDGELLARQDDLLEGAA